ncbi:hypothetical protein EJB05_38526 [Eragrostis curvula]|uniref:Myb-like domain-containing protein n=1 Tax=Eragrostis curvula TaxID=38414 RepID=A0A5J9TUI5_9POAL|nr:hypothetical protein EJB05_38526 [Eragrostis curvula]
MGPFSPPAASGAMPLSSRPPASAQPQPQQQQLRTSYEELAAVSGAGGAGGFPDDEALGDAGGAERRRVGRVRRQPVAAGGDAGAHQDPVGDGRHVPRRHAQGPPVGGRLQRERERHTFSSNISALDVCLLLLPLADLGYKRSAKKCKEKFENVHKYYKRTKEGRAGRQDGKSYRFFSELEALHAAGAAPQPQQQQQQPLPPGSSAPPLHAFTAPVSAPPPMNSLPPSTAAPMQPAPISSAAPAPAPLELPPQQPLNLQGLSSFSSMSDSDSDGDSEDDHMTAETGGTLGKRKRGGGSKKMMSFFEGLMQQVVERQEEMQRRFLETMEKREAERSAREEAWRRQEVARLNREQDQLAQERSAAASRDAAIIAFLHRIGGHSVQPPTAVPMPVQRQAQTTPPPKQPPPRQPPPTPPPQATPPPPKPISASPLQQQPPPQQQQQHKEASHHEASTPRSAPPTSGASLELVVPASEQQHASGVSSSRWPKAEVHALIQLRMDMDTRYQDSSAKGPLWEDISVGMRRLGYNRSSKRCKEKWENINKYYKKVKESNKKRPEDSKTCPYFHQLEEIYRRKQQLGGGAPASVANVIATAPTPAFPADQLNPSRLEIEGKNINDDKRNNGGSGGGAQVPTSNGEAAPTPTGRRAHDVDSGSKKPEDIVRELTEQPPRELTTDETDSDDEYTDDGEEAEDDGKMQYRIQFQRPTPGGTNSAPAPATATAPAVPASAPASTFVAMVQ